MSYEKTFKQLLATADIAVNGDRPWDMKVHNPKVYRRILSEGSLGLGESYMDGWWNCDRLDIFFAKVIEADLEKTVKGSWVYLKNAAIARICNPQCKRRAFQVGAKHYDTGNELYSLMLDPRMTYSCAYWKGLKEVPENLAKAQEQKLDLVCKKLGLEKGMHVLDIGCGWGSFMKYAAENYHVNVKGYTVSKEQVKLGKKLSEGLQVEFILKDYRSATEAGGKFDRVVSLGMFEHVGYKNYREYMAVVDGCLKPEGLFLLQTIGNISSKPTVEPWITKYIFPNGNLPSIKQIAESAEGIFDIEDFHGFGKYYDPTCMAWNHNVVENWDKIKDIKGSDGNPKYDDRFYRMWTYWLQMSAGSSRSSGKLWQVVFSKGRKKDYQSVR